MFKVRVENFQSIKNASIVVDGLTVVTGANNSGKTALLRAIRGVFENSPHSSLLRKDENKIEVELEFEDGQSVLWEKGPKDNSYTINGYKISGVGRGAPEELKDLGVYPIEAANNTVWPQVAKQFEGTIFLLNRSGAVLAEALSDVEKVGKLTSALRLSEKDRRAVNSELKVRRKDLKVQEEKVLRFEGFDEVEDQMESLKETVSRLKEEFSKVALVRSLFERLNACRASLKRFEGFEPDVLPNKGGPEVLNSKYKLLSDLNARFSRVFGKSKYYQGFEEPTLPETGLADKISKAIIKVETSKATLETRKAKADLYSSFEIPELPLFEGLKEKSQQTQKLERLLLSLKKRHSEALETKNMENLMRTNLDKASALIDELLGDLGECPICKTPHEQ